MARILIVDDDPDIVEAARLVLEKEGHALRGASSRAEGMKALEAFDPELLILDVMMEQPDDGFAMAQELRAMGRKLPILMLTSVSSASGLTFDWDEEMVPVDDFQSKPMKPADLVHRVTRLLQA